MSFKDIFPPVEVVLEMEPEELAPFVLKDLETRSEGINRYNYTLKTDRRIQDYAGEHTDEFCERLMEAFIWLERELFLAPKPGSAEEWRMITRRGRRILESEDYDAYKKGALESRPSSK